MRCVGTAHRYSRIGFAVVPVGADHRGLAAERDFSRRRHWTHPKRLSCVAAHRVWHAYIEWPTDRLLDFALHQAAGSADGSRSVGLIASERTVFDFGGCQTWLSNRERIRVGSKKCLIYLVIPAG